MNTENAVLFCHLMKTRKGRHRLVKGLPCAFPAGSGAKEHSETIDDLVVPKAPPCKVYLLTDGGEDAPLYADRRRAKRVLRIKEAHVT